MGYKNTMKEKIIESEKYLENKLRVDTEALGGYCFKFVPQFISGLPDRICMFKGGHVVFAELKTTKQRPRKLQLLWHKRFRDLGFRVEIIDSSKQIDELIKEYGGKK